MLRLPRTPMSTVRRIGRYGATLVLLAMLPGLTLAAPFSATPQATSSSGTAARQVDAPPSLAAWSGWVAQSRDDRGCPQATEKACVWLSPLVVTLDGPTVRFAFSARNLASEPRYLQLPGRLSAWPHDVRANGQPRPVEARGDTAGLDLPAGFDGRIEGEMQRHGLDPLPLDPGFPWASVSVTGHPGQTRLVAITADGLVLDRADDAEAPGAASASGPSSLPMVKVQHYLTDGQIPEMQLRVRVINPGARASVVLTGLLPPGAQAFGLVSSGPARWEHGRLQIGALPGEQAVTLSVRLPPKLTDLGSHPVADGATLDPQDYWFVRSDARLRRLTITSPAVDPHTVPHDPVWDNVPTYVTASGAPLALTAQATQDDLPRITATAHSDLWLDLDGNGATLRQTLTGTAPLPGVFTVDPSWKLQEAQMGNAPVLIGQASPQVPQTVAHRPGPFDAHLSARGPDGWTLKIPNVLHQDVEASQSTIAVHLPPGALVLGASGQGVNSVGWWASFSLWDWFWIILLAWALQAMLGWRVAVLGVLTVTLGHLFPGRMGPVWLLPLLALPWLTQAVPVARHGLRAITLIWGSLVALMLVMMTVPRVIEILHPVMALQGPGSHRPGDLAVALFALLGSFADLITGFMFLLGLAFCLYAMIKLIMAVKGDPFPLRAWVLGPIGLLLVALPAYLAMGSSTINADGARQNGLTTGVYSRIDDGNAALPAAAQEPSMPRPEMMNQVNAMAVATPEAKAPPMNFQGQGGAQVQTGEPQWTGAVTWLEVSGPVTSAQPLTLWWLPSPLARLGNLAQMVMLWALVVLIARGIRTIWARADDRAHDRAETPRSPSTAHDDSEGDLP